MLTKQSKSFSLIDCISVGVDRMRSTRSSARDLLESLECIHVRIQGTDSIPQLKVTAKLASSRRRGSRRRSSLRDGIGRPVLVYA